MFGGPVCSVMLINERKLVLECICRLNREYESVLIVLELSYKLYLLVGLRAFSMVISLSRVFTL